MYINHHIPSDENGAFCKGNLPLGSPVHHIIGGDERGNHVPHLGGEATPGVEDCVMQGSGEGVLSIGGETVGDDALLFLATW